MRVSDRLRQVHAGVAATVAACAFASSAAGQTVGDVHAGLRAAADSDTVDWPAAVQDLYRELHEQADRSGVEIVRNVRYGVFPAQTLDLYLPAERAGELAPVVVFVHGGNLDDGDKSAPGAEEFLFGNVATFLRATGSSPSMPTIAWFPISSGRRGRKTCARYWAG